MKVLFISQFFEPEPAFKGLQFAKALMARGHSVEVLTGFPNYPGGKVYPGYRLAPFSREVMDGVRVNRVYLHPSHDRSAIGRSANYLSFALTASIGALTAARRPDVAYVYHPPATAVLPAIVLRRLRGVPYVVDIQDLWPDTISATGMLSNGRALRALGALAALTYREAARVAVQSEGFYAALRARGVPAEKLAVIHNWADERAFMGIPPAAPHPEGRLNVLFAGTMGMAQALDTVLETAALAATSLPHVTFTFIGGGIDRARLQAAAGERQLHNVVFLPRRDPAEMADVFAAADVLLVHLKDDPLFRITIPSKTQAYLAVGRPILMATRGDAATLVERAGGGVVCAPNDPAAMLTALRRLDAMTPVERAAMAASGQAYYREQLSLEVGAERFEQLFRAAIKSARGTAGVREG